MDIRQFQQDPAVRETLEARAQQLAARYAAADTGALGEAVLTFHLGDGRYSVPAHAVREVAPLREYTALPATPAFVVGLINLRGRLLAVVDIHPLLGQPGAAVKPGSFVVIVGGGGVEIAMLADTVAEVARSAGELMPALSSAASRDLAWVIGIDSQLTLRLDVAGLLADPQLIVGRGERRHARTRRLSC